MHMSSYIDRVPFSQSRGEKKGRGYSSSFIIFHGFTAIETVNVFPEQRYQINIFCPLFSFLSETCL